MSSLQDQLLQAGLTDKKQAQRVKQEQRKKHKAQRKQKVVEVDESKLAAQKALEEKKARDRELNAKNKAEAQKREVTAQIKQLIQSNAQPKDNGDIAFNFTDDSKVKQLHVNELTHKRLTNGKLAIVTLEGTYQIVPMPVADKIAERDDSYVLHRADKVQENTGTEEDDWYAEYEIPDDLMW
ncbi:uncharacterized protein HMF8227_01268 [Saliniradius amylolyticus]|uniref:Nucleoprotein/polynucleotide-associated enzyme n=1 Tax=Saliniradius amylolyticus TaxID=2183582 RepID=A0A2S2E271_9ALTE|nr:DUF2058 domain-containing protein [Saliniradius amylolyticus]AWL11746.1 uncharacterized protein HMF8227_01268 [Saliniradius amylolyticus]